MKVQINATGWRFSSDTETVKETPGAVKFLEDHGVPFERYTTKADNEKLLEWHESVNMVEIPVLTMDDMKKYCTDYNATFEVHAEYTTIKFN